MKDDKKCCVIFSTTDDLSVAEKLAKELLAQKVAACIQIDQVKSYFEYEGKFSSTDEYRLMIKAASENYDKIVELIKTHHNYQLPQIVKLDINNGTEEYINWVLGK